MARNIVKEAEKFARKTHKRQKQVTGKPYFQHPKKVASLLEKWKQDKEVIAAGYLHDIIEDSGISLKQLKQKFGERIAFLVDGMSWERDKKTRIKNWPKTYKKFIDTTKKDPAIVLIKLADMISNIPNIHSKKQRNFIINKSYPKFKAFWQPFLEATGFSKEMKKIEKVYNKYVKKRIKIELYDYISKKDLKKIKEKLK